MWQFEGASYLGFSPGRHLHQILTQHSHGRYVLCYVEARYMDGRNVPSHLDGKDDAFLGAGCSFLSSGIVACMHLHLRWRKDLGRHTLTAGSSGSPAFHRHGPSR